MQCLNNKSTLFDFLSQGAFVITPNNRLSGELLKDYFRLQTHTSVDKPFCMPWSTALGHAWQKLQFQNPEHPLPTVLTRVQCQHLWRKIIAADSAITYSEGLLNAVMEAWMHCLQWQIPPENLNFDYSPQTLKFQEWWLIFNQEIKKINAITEYELIPCLLKTGAPSKQKNSNRSLLTQTLIWVCFDEFTPQQIALQDHLTRQGQTQYRYDLPESKVVPHLFSASDTQEEFQQLIAWLHLKIQQGVQRIGLVVPDLQQGSRTLQRTILNHFDPALFNISLGQTMAEFPLVAHAMAWLTLDSPLITPHQAALLLQSPYIGFAREEFSSRSQYLQDSTLLQDQNIPLDALIQDLRPHAPKLAHLLENLKSFPKDASPETWIQCIQERLHSAGFPGDYGLSSKNYQCLNRFSEILDEFRQLNLLSPCLTTTEALAALTSLTENTIFQAQKNHARIQISGLLEASGCEFDCLWVMGLTDQCLPQKTRLSPFIPPQLQRKLLMPHSIPARELQFAQQILARLQRSAAETVFSYPRLQGDNPILPCALITDYPAFQPLALTNPLNHSLNSSLILTEENWNIPFLTEERKSGGTALLANQAKCPFKAFAEHRLGAKRAPATSDGLDARERGQIIHKVMELLWQTLKTQRELLQLSTAALDKHIEQAIHTVLSPINQLRPASFSQLVQKIESIRIKRLILFCLEWEKQRPPFEIAALEQNYSINLAGLNFQVRVDRLDKVDENKWVIDYKSTLPASKPWNEDRPKEPQLLLYALLDEQINTLFFMQLKSGKITISGLSEEDPKISGITSLKKEETWSQCTSNWRQQLTVLAEEFQQGHCPPKPAHPSLCQLCDFQNLCRFQQD